MSPQVEPVVVVGAGVSGLTTAICLAEAGHEVKVWAADPPRRTTSMVAGALWGPSFQEPVARTLVWTQQSLRDFTVLARDPGSGVRMAAALTVGDLPGLDELPPQARLIPDLRPADPAEVPEGFGRGFRHAGRVVCGSVSVPGRRTVRLDTETSGATRYVHNYGHGGNGVSLSWGCAREAAHLAVS